MIEKYKRNRIIGIILISFQLLAYFGAVIGDENIIIQSTFFETIGYNLIGIIGIIIIVKYSKRNQENQNLKKKN